MTGAHPVCKQAPRREKQREKLAWGDNGELSSFGSPIFFALFSPPRSLLSG